jgi:hypothetical protein
VKVTWEFETEATVTGFFQPSDIRYELEVYSAGGTVALDPSPPSGGYPINTIVTVTARAATGYLFDLWRGGLTGRANPAEVTMDANLSVTAVFNPTMNVLTDPTGGGTVVLDPGQPLNGYVAGSTVVLRPVPAEGYRFDHWSGDVSGTSKTATLTVDVPREVWAHFVKRDSFAWWWIAIGVGLLLAGSVVLILWRSRHAQGEF